MTGKQWIRAFSTRLGIDPPDDATIDRLLELASAAAHGSERLAAPIACYLVGRAGLDPSKALAMAREVQD
jgi:hypothetical protein